MSRRRQLLLDRATTARQLSTLFDSPDASTTKTRGLLDDFARSHPLQSPAPPAESRVTAEQQLDRVRAEYGLCAAVPTFVVYRHVLRVLAPIAARGGRLIPPSFEDAKEDPLLTRLEKVNSAVISPIIEQFSPTLRRSPVVEVLTQRRYELIPPYHAALEDAWRLRYPDRQWGDLGDMPWPKRAQALWLVSTHKTLRADVLPVLIDSPSINMIDVVLVAQQARGLDVDVDELAQPELASQIADTAQLPGDVVRHDTNYRIYDFDRPPREVLIEDVTTPAGLHCLLSSDDESGFCIANISFRLDDGDAEGARELGIDCGPSRLVTTARIFSHTLAHTCRELDASDAVTITQSECQRGSLATPTM